MIIHNYYLDKNEKPFPASKIWKTASYLSLFNNNNCKRISLIEKVYRPPIEKTVTSLTAGLPPQASTPVYSFIEQICGLSFFAKKVNVYGWDFYLTSSPKKMGYWQLFFNMYKFKLDARARNHFEAALINFYYGYHLSKLPNFNIRGYMAQLGKHKKLIKRIERVLFN